ncbi:MAG: UDP-4-amino-4,6-dideoxy-N-acetyl-beta-L-altrosamine transaminase [Alphaproteobacteria bacterium]|nr:UDP-4-amino-4,6-dideoxy-N-acetyl-beta-L-altrosamine transaminase [Alphaproteobacteria bacterium]
MDGAGSRFLPYGRQLIDEADIAAVAAVLRSPYLTTGPAVADFERKLAAMVGAPYAISCANGTAALHLACLALGLGPGDAAIVPAITFLATANAPRMTGAEIVFADVDAASGLMQPSHLEDAIVRAEKTGLRVRAVLPVHLAGHCADLPALAGLARAHGIAIVEDACHALGGGYRHGDSGFVPVGACRDSDIAVFSFHPVKNATTGEGGAITTRDPALADRIACLRSHGMVREPERFRCERMGFDPSGAPHPWYYEMAEIGWNYRLSDIHAALGTSQLGKLERYIVERGRLATLHDAALAALAPWVVPIARSPDCRPGWHLYPVLIDFAGLGIGRGALMRDLAGRGIGTQVHYIPVCRQPYYRSRYGAIELPGAESYYARTLSLPLFVGMTRRDIDHIAAALADAVAKAPVTRQ